MMTGRELRPTHGPVHSDSHKLFAQNGALVLTPGDRLPVGLWQGLEDGFGRIEGWRAGLLGLATALGPWRRYARCGMDPSGRRTPKVLLMPTT
jgi:hypothetical protein